MKTNIKKFEAKNILSSSIDVKKEMLNDIHFGKFINQVVELCIHAFKSDGRVFWCGNGGSAADAQHLAAELSGKFYLDRQPLPSEALHVNSSFLTAVANDFGYSMVFSRMIEAHGRKGDVLICLSTSGNSENILNAISKAVEKGLNVVGMSGKFGGDMKDLCDLIYLVPSQDTPRIQECHLTIGHIICQLIEKEMFAIKSERDNK